MKATRSVEHRVKVHTDALVTVGTRLFELKDAIDAAMLSGEEAKSAVHGTEAQEGANVSDRPEEKGDDPGTEARLGTEFQIPFNHSQDIRNVLAVPENAEALLNHLLRRIRRFDAARFPRQFCNIVLTEKYKSSVYWPPASGM